MFLDENTRSHRGLGVVVEDLNGPLHDDRSAVELLGHEVHRGASNLYPVLQRLTLSVQSGERRKERGVDVQNGLRIRLEQRCADQPHVAGQTYETNITRAQLSSNGFFVVVTRRGLPMIEAEGLDAGAPSDLQATSVWAIRDHHRNNGIQPPVADRVDERLKITAPARDENAKTTVHSRFT